MLDSQYEFKEIRSDKHKSVSHIKLPVNTKSKFEDMHELLHASAIDEIPDALKPRGITNPSGTTCYINTFVQLMLQIPEFIILLKTTKLKTGYIGIFKDILTAVEHGESTTSID